MSRNKGNAIFSGNFEPRMAAPLDARLVVDNKIDLYNLTTWNGGDGNAYIYKGMVVSVINDTPSNNGLYRLTDDDYTESSNWILVGSTDSSGTTQYIGTNGITVEDDEIKLGGVIGKNTKISLIGGNLEFNSNITLPEPLNGTISFFEKDNDGNYVIGGDFTKYGDTTVNKLIKLNSDYELNIPFNENILSTDFYTAIPKQIAFFSNNDFVILINQNTLLKFNLNGILSTEFEITETPLEYVIFSKIGIQSNDKLLVGFVYHKSTEHPNIWRYDSDGVKDETFNPPPFQGDIDKGGGTNDFIIFEDDSILICGMLYYYHEINGVSYYDVMFLNADGEHIIKTINFDSALGYGEYYKIKRITNTEFLLFADSTNPNQHITFKMVYDSSMDTYEVIKLFSMTGGRFGIKTTDLLTNDDFYVLYGTNILVNNTVDYGKILKFDKNGNHVDSFNFKELGTGFDGDIWEIKLLENDLILVLGNFTTYNGKGLDTEGIIVFDKNFNVFGGYPVSIKKTLIKYDGNYEYLYDKRTLVDKEYVDSRMGGSGVTNTYVEITYAELVTKITQGELIPLQKYILTDYQTAHYYLDENNTINEYNLGEVEPLIITAISEETIDFEVRSLYYSQDVIYYDWNPDNWTDDIGFSHKSTKDLVTGFKGVIYHRHDTKNNNSLGYDFRNVKFRRWAISGTSFDLSETEFVNDYQSASSSTISSDIQVNPSDYIDVFTFQVDNISDYENNVKNNIIEGKIGSRDHLWFFSSTILTNNVFYVTTQVTDNYINAGAIRNTFNGVVFGNSIGVLAIGNMVGNDFVGNKLFNDFFNNIIFGRFSSNDIGISFQRNLIKLQFHENKIEQNFTYNNIEYGFTNNVINKGFSTNNIGLDFSENTCSVDFSNNYIGDSCQSNEFKAKFRGNILGNDENDLFSGFNSNTVELGINDSTLTASELYGGYSTTVFKLSNVLNTPNADTVKIRYYDDNMDLIIKSAKE